jgi:4'-phosphopantetheinyl transferase
MTDWQSMTTPPPLAAQQVHVWRVDLAPVGDWQALTAQLSADEQARAGRYRFDLHRRRYVLGRTALRRLLVGYLQCAPATIRFRYNDFGKPSLADDQARLRFNLSRTEDTLLCAFAQDSDIGIDIESIDPDIDCLAISQRYFSDRERDALLRLSGEKLRKGFFRLWSRKEAYIKALGNGLSHPLQDFSIADDCNPAPVVEHAAAGIWQVHDLDAGAGTAAALALPHGNWRLRCFRYAAPTPAADARSA